VTTSARNASIIVVKLHGGPLTGQLASFPNATSTIAVTSDEQDRTAELVLWPIDAIDERSVRDTITRCQPTPILVILAASMRPTSAHIAQCLNLGAHQCLIDPTIDELVAHVHAIARRLHNPPKRTAAT